MKSSIFIAASSAALAFAGVIDRRHLVTQIITEYNTVTVTEGASSTSLSSTKVKSFHHSSISKPQRLHTASTTVKLTTIIEPTTSSSPTVVVVTETFVPQPEPTTTAATTTQEAPAAPVESYASTVKAEVATTAVEESSTASPSDMPSWAVWSHNVHRANHSAPAMEWNETIAGYASLTADKCVFAHDMSEGNGGYGQNLAMWGTTDNPEALGDAGAIKMATSDMWYNGEFNKFLPEFYGQADPNKSDFESWGHFSQLLWVDSTGLGCSVKLCAKGTMFNDMEAWFMVCNYYPAGNFEGAYGDNVKKPEGKPVITSTSE